MEIINVTDEIIEINVTEAVVNIISQTGAYPLPSNVFSVFGRVGNVVGQAGDYTTSLVAEGTNLYYTNARSRAAISETITGINYDSASGIFSMASGYVIPTQAMLDAKVPYTGATGNVTLGEYQLSAGQVTFDQTPTGTAGVGVLRWNDNDGTLDLGLKGGNVTLQVGQEQLKRVVNKSGVSLAESAYQVVKIQGAQGQRLAVELAQGSNDLNSATTLGIVTETIALNQEGFITTSGEVREINTTGSLQGETWADGDILYLSPSVAGKITNVKPTAPNHMVIVGYVEYAHNVHGKIFVKVDNGYELDELHNVKIVTPLNNQALVYDSADSVWKNESIDSALGYTPVPTTRTISTTAPLTGGGDLSINRTLSMPAATSSANGYLTSTDWSTFNGKQPLIAAGSTTQYYRGDKTFQTLNTGVVPENGNLYYTDARARAAISGTLPISVASGVVSISQAGGASNGYLSSTDWNTFNNKQTALNGTGFVKISGTTISYDNNTYLTTINGITAGGELSGTYANPSLVNSAVTGKILSGVNITGGSIADTDSILTAFGKLQNQVNGLIGGSIYKGTWNASTNTPTLASGVGSKGFYYITDVSGTTTLDGISEWHVGDWAIFDGVKWQKVDTTDAVISVNGEVGAVSLTTSNIAEGTNLYFTNARAIASTLTGYTSGSGTISSSDTILTAIQKLNGNVSGLVTGVSSVFGRTGAVIAASGDYTTTQVTEGTNLYYTQGRFDTAFDLKSTTNLTEGTNLYYTSARFDTAFSGKSTTNLAEGTNLYYTEARVNANTNVAANTAARHNAVTLGTANGLSLSTQVLSLAAASTSATGALTSTDWNTFNNKQAALNGTGFVKISGTTISYDNSTYLTTSSAASTYLPLAGGTLTGALSGTTATFSGNVTALDAIINNGANSTSGIKVISSLSGSLYTGGIEFIRTTTLSGSKIEPFRDAGVGGVGFKFLTTANNSAETSGTYSTALTILNTGAATFSSIITSNDTYGLTLGSVANKRRIQYGSDVATSFTFLTDANGYAGLYAGSSFFTGSITSANTGFGNTGGFIINYGATAGSTSWRLANDLNAFGDFAIQQSTTQTGSTYASKLYINPTGNVGIGTADVDSRFKAELLNVASLRIAYNGTSVNYMDADNNIFRSGNGTERMRITSGGNVLIGQTTASGSTNGIYFRVGIESGFIVTNDNALQLSRYSSNGDIETFYRDATKVGSISVTTTLTSYNVTSDYRLKQDLKEYNGLELVSKIKTYDYQWKIDSSRMYGVVAHELQEVIPYAVLGEKDGEEMQQVDYSKLVPVLIKSIQELEARIKQLENK